MTSTQSRRIDARAITLFFTIAFGGAWLVVSPLWLSDAGLAHPLAPLLLIAMMFTPAVAALIAAKVFPSGERFLRDTTLRPAKPFRHWWRYGLIAWFGPLILVLAAVAVAAAIGWLRLDLVNFSGFADTLAQSTGGMELPISVQTLVIIQLVSVLFIPVLNVIPAMGEELGWRGYLQARLLPLGQWPAVLITGVAWGLWHAPIILLGYNFPGYPPLLALAMMVIFTTLASVLLGWLTIAAGTVWVAAIAHGFINGVAGLPLLLAASGPVDPAASTLAGFPGWIVMALVIALLVVLRRFPVTGTAAPAAADSSATSASASAPAAAAPAAADQQP